MIGKKEIPCILRFVLMVTVTWLMNLNFIYAQGKSDMKIDSTAIIFTALNYMEGAYTADADRMQKAIWPELNKITPRIIPQTGRMILASNCYSQLIDGVRQAKGMVNNSDKKIEVTIQTINEGMASVKITSSMFNDYLHMARIGEEWK